MEKENEELQNNATAIYGKMEVANMKVREMEKLLQEVHCMGKSDLARTFRNCL